MSVICTNLGGSLEDKRVGYTWCRRNSDNMPLFGFSEGKAEKPGCYQYNNTAAQYSFRIVALAKDKANPSDAFLRLAGTLGFTNKKIEKLKTEDKKNAEISERKRKIAAQIKEEERRKQFMPEQRRIDIETPKIISTRGLQICKRDKWNQPYPYYVGWVEDYSNGKIKVRVNARLYDRNSYDRYFQPQIIWDYPETWRICE